MLWYSLEKSVISRSTLLRHFWWVPTMYVFVEIMWIPPLTWSYDILIYFGVNTHTHTHTHKHTNTPTHTNIFISLYWPMHSSRQNVVFYLLFNLNVSIFFLFLHRNIRSELVNIHWNCPKEATPLSSHNICYQGEIRKLFILTPLFL